MADEKKKPHQGAVGCFALAVVAAGALYSRCAADTPPDPAGRTPEKVTEDERKKTAEARTAAAPPPTPERQHPGLVSAAEFGAAWPFTASEGMLACLPNAGRPVVLFTTNDNRRYAINGNARDLVDGTAIRDLKEIEKQTEPRPSVQPMIAHALRLCPK